MAQSIRVESGTYGANCGARQGKGARDLAVHCDTLRTLRYVIDATSVHGRPNGCAADLVADARVRAWKVEVENFESIHNHSAFARIASDGAAASAIALGEAKP